MTGCSLFGGSEDSTPPGPPTDLNAASQDAAIALDWSAVQTDDLAGYNVYRSTSSIGEVSGLDPVNGNEPVTQASYADESLENGTTYYYVLTAVDKAENESDPSGEVEKTPFPEPSGRP